MKSRAIAFLVLFASHSAIAQLRVKNVEVLDYGIYKIEAQSSQVRLARATTTVPAERGVEFGIRYKIDGAPIGTAVPLRELTIFPSPGLRPPTASHPIPSSKTETKAKIGEVSYTGYQLDDPWELLPGVWVIQLWYGDRKVAQERFTVVAPLAH
ncbi:MAG: DUF3859 domain-containing protein [Xanthobacteraceae bacterium]